MTERGSVLLLAKKWSQNLATETTSVSCTRCIKARTQSVLSAGSASGSYMSQQSSIWAEIIRGLDMIGRFVLRCLMDWLWPEAWLPCHVGISGDYEMSLQGRKSREGATGREPWRLWDLDFKTVHGHFCLFMCMITISWSRSYSREGAHFCRDCWVCTCASLQWTRFASSGEGCPVKLTCTYHMLLLEDSGRKRFQLYFSGRTTKSKSFSHVSASVSPSRKEMAGLSNPNKQSLSKHKII